MDGESDSESEISRTLYDIYIENQLREFPEKPPESFNEDKKNFAAKLRWIRWKIYQKVGYKISTTVDVEKYEELVNKYVTKFETTQLTDWEVSIWKNKVLKTKNDVFASIFKSESVASEILSEDSRKEFSVMNDQELNDEDDEIIEEVDSITKIFDNAKVYEHLCFNLPNVSTVEDPDEEIEERLWRLKERDENDGFERDYNKSEVKAKDVKVPLLLENKDVKEIEAKTKYLEVKEIKSDKKETDTCYDKIEDMEKKMSNIDDKLIKEEFNKWYESNLEVKKMKTKVRVSSDDPPDDDFFAESSYTEKMYKNNEYKQVYTSSSVQDTMKVPDLVCFLKAYFVVLISTCKTLNDTIVTFSSLSQSSFSVIPFQPILQSPMSQRTMPTCKSESRCYCVKATNAVTRGVISLVDMIKTASRGVSVWCRWTRSRVQNLREKMKLAHCVLVSEHFEHFEPFEELKEVGGLNVKNSRELLMKM